MKSGTLNITNAAYGINSSYMDGEGDRVFKFLGGVVNITADEGSFFAGIDVQRGNMEIRNAEINIDLPHGFGLAVGWTDENNNNKLYGGELTLENAVVNVAREKGGYGNGYSAYFYKLNDLSNSLYYTGSRAANIEKDFDDVFEINESLNNRYDCDSEYLTISPTPIDVQMLFDDVKAGDWYYDYAEYVFKNGIMTGLDDVTFGPSETLARAQFAVILHRMNGAPAMDYTAKFPDVPEGEWFTDAVLWANSTGVVKGYEDGTGRFGSADYITREQMAVMMYRYAQYKQYVTDETADYSQFTDAGSVSEFAKEAMKWAVGSGIISGKDGGTRLDPQGNASRAECATIITRFMEKYE